MYCQINDLFRKKPHITVSTLLIPADEVDLLVGADIDVNTVIADAQGNRVVSDVTQKLDLIGTSFGTINQPHLERGSAMLNQMIERKVSDFKATLNGTPILHFNDALRADLIPDDSLDD